MLVTIAPFARAEETAARFGVIERLDPRFDRLLASDARLEVVAEGFHWLEGPAWNKQDASLLFSDIPANAIYRWNAEDGVRLFMRPSGYTGASPFEGREPGSNGLTFDREGRLVICEHGDRRVRRLEPDGAKTMLAEHYEGRRLNSPNDAVVASTGELYFTDPPFGLPQAFDDPAKELPFSGVFRRTPAGALILLEDKIKAPNGIAFSPDETLLYLTDVDPEHPAWLVYEVTAQGNLANGRVFFDAARWQGMRPGTPDGLKVDREGNLFAAGPGGVYVFAPDGSHLGTVQTGVATGNLAWGEDGATLFITADRRLLRLRTLTRGPGF